MPEIPFDSKYMTKTFSINKQKELKDIINLLKTENTERKHIVNELRKSRDRLITIIESISDGFFTLDNNFVVTYFNKSAGILLARKPEEILGRNLFEAFPEAKGSIFEEKYTEAIRERKALNFETYFGVEPYKNWFDVRVYPFESGISVFFQVTTERKKLEEELLKARKLESIGILAGGIAHDFNNLFQGIIMGIAIAKMKSHEPDVIKALEKVENQCINAQTLSNMLITFSKGEDPILRESSIKKLLIDLLHHTKFNPEIEINLFIPENIYKVKIDENQISIAITKILENSVEAMPNGGLISIDAINFDSVINENLLLKESKYVKLTISDTGKGVPEENVHKIFDPYFSTKETYYQKGMGLGLTIAYSIIKKHEGLITVESTPGKGTSFHIYLPAA